MTSIVVSLYFKQENCETLISLYNWGRMKHCQSELVSCKVEWFCSLAVFSRWPGLSLFLSFSLSACLRSLLALCSSPFFTKSGEKALLERATGWGMLYWSVNCDQLQLCRVPAACSLATTTCRPPPSPPLPLPSFLSVLHVFTGAEWHAHSLCLLLVCSATVFVLICILLNEKQVLWSLSCCIKPCVNSQVCRAITRCLCGVMKMCSVLRLFVKDAEMWRPMP